MTAEAPSDLIFGKYQIVRRIAVGGMGEIYLARQTGLPGFERMAILKSLLPDLAAEPGFVDQFLDEARVAATLNHPNVVAIYEVGLWEGVYYIAMEYISGRNLLELRRSSLAPLPVEVALSIIRDAARGLDHAHHAVDVDGKPLHIVHRDVSPQNIMVRNDGVTKVVDFGIARANNREGRTATGMIKGKLAYMSPEQLAGKAVDARTDQFALGAVLWELLTGVRLFRGENDLETSLKVLSAPIPKPTEQLASLPPALDTVVMRMLDRDPARRYARLGEAADDLERLAMTYGPGTGERHVSAFVSTLPSMPAAKSKPPVSGNFVISLGESSGPTPPPKPRPSPLPSTSARRPAAPPPDEDAEEATTVAQVEPRASAPPPRPAQPPSQVETQTQDSPRPTRRLPMIVGAAGLVAAVVAAVWWMGRSAAPTNPPVVVAVPAVARPAAPRVPDPVAVPAPAPAPVDGRVELRLEVSPAGAAVELDGAALAAPVAKVSPGQPHKLKVSAAGYLTQELAVTPTADQRVNVELHRAPPQRGHGKAHGPQHSGAKQPGKLIMDQHDVFN